jgi:hypothetical protein
LGFGRARARTFNRFRRDFLGIPAIGKHHSVPLIDIFEPDSNGRFREHCGVMGAMSHMQPLGRTSAPTQAWRDEVACLSAR